MNQFYTKFFQVREKVTTFSLGRESQKRSEDIIDFIKRFQDRAVDCHEPVSEAHLVEICVDSLLREYRVHLINMKIPTFSGLLEAAYNLRYTVTLPPKDSWKKAAVVAAATSAPPAQRPQGAGGNGNKFKKRKDRGNEQDEGPPPDYPCGIQEVEALLQQWITDGTIRLPHVLAPPTQRDRESPNFCSYHRHTKHPMNDCFTLKRIFKRKIDAGELRIGAGAQDVRENPYPEHQRVVNMAECFDFYAELDNYEEEAYMASIQDHLEEVSYEQPRVEPDPDATIKILQGSAKFRTFFDGMGFTPAARFDITKSIIDIARAHQQACMAAEGSVPRTIRDESNLVTFSESDRRVKFPHTRPLFVTAYVNGAELRRAFFDGGASINIMPYSTFKKLEIPENRVVESSIAITGFGGERKESAGYVVVDLAVGPIRAATKFHLIDAQTNYHIILGRRWMYKYAVIPSSYHQCLKGIWAEKQVTVGASDRPFDSTEAHMTDAVYFSELAEEGEVIYAKPVSIRIPRWEDISAGEGASASKRPPTQQPPMKARKITKVREGGKVVYCL